MSLSHSKNEISEETPVRCAGGVWTKEKYMTVNLSLIVGHIRNWKAPFRRGMFVLEESRESVVSVGAESALRIRQSGLNAICHVDVTGSTWRRKEGETLTCKSILHVHRIAVNAGKVEAGATLGTVGAEPKAALLCLRNIGIVFDIVFIREVFLDHVVCLHVDFLVCICLAVVDLLHSVALLNEQSISVDALLSFTSSILIHFTNLQDVLKTIKGDLNNLVIWAS